MQWLLVKDETIENIVAWDGSTEWTPPDGHDLVGYDGDPAAVIGWGWVDGHLVVPPEPDPIKQEAPTIVE
jgi:hypothetical protein